MCDGNYIKLNRKLLEWEWYKEANTARVFLHCLLKANWKDGKFKGYDIPRGSFVSSPQTIAEDLGLTRQQIRTAIKHLILTNNLTNVSTSQFSIFTVVNYDIYQESNQQSNQQVTNSQPTSNHNRRKKEGKKEINNNNVEQIKIIIDYLNEKAGTKYQYQTTSTQKHINARLSENYTIDNFKTVIDKKVAEWNHEPKDGKTDMRPYIRPETLFGAKFENYLNQSVVAKKNNQKPKTNKFNNFPQRDNNYDDESKWIDN